MEGVQAYYDPIPINISALEQFYSLNQTPDLVAMK